MLGFYIYALCDKYIYALCDKSVFMSNFTREKNLYTLPKILQDVIHKLLRITKFQIFTILQNLTFKDLFQLEDRL